VTHNLVDRPSHDPEHSHLEDGGGQVVHLAELRDGQDQDRERRRATDRHQLSAVVEERN